MTTTSKYIKPYNIENRIELWKKEFSRHIHIDESIKTITIFKNVGVFMEFKTLEENYKDYIINVEGTVHIESDMFFANNINWGYINGMFYTFINTNNLETLSFPKEVRGDFFVNCTSVNDDITLENIKNYIKERCKTEYVYVYNLNYVSLE